MEKKIDNYIEVLFSDIPRSKKAIELKEELRANMNERYQDYLQQGESETQAYSLTVANIGNVDEMLCEVMPNESFKEEAQRYRVRNAKLTGFSVGLYILGPAILVASALFGDQAAVIGVVLLLICTAIATGIIVYSNMSIPQEYKDYLEQSDGRHVVSMRSSNKKMQAILSLFWSVVLVAYLLWSFISSAWQITWIIWPIAGVTSGIIKTIFELRNSNEQ